MLDSLGVDLRLTRIHARGDQESEHELVTRARFFCHGFPGRCQRDGFARLRLDESLALEACDDPRDCDMTDTHDLAELADTRLSSERDELVDRFDIVLRCFIAMRLARRDKAFRDIKIGLASARHSEL